MIMIAAREGASQVKSARGTSEAEQTAAVFGVCFPSRDRSSRIACITKGVGMPLFVFAREQQQESGPVP